MALPRFVVHQHQARHLYYDFRLEMNGVLRSWAVPKGMPQRSGVRRLAIEWKTIHWGTSTLKGAIPQVQYGAGTVRIWDTDTYTLKKAEPDELKFVLHGTKLKGVFCIVANEESAEELDSFKA